AILREIQIPDSVLAALQESVSRDQDQAEKITAAQRQAMQTRLSAVRRRIDQAYQDKLDGKIPDEFWERKMRAWSGEERGIQEALARLEQPTRERLLTAQRLQTDELIISRTWNAKRPSGRIVNALLSESIAVLHDDRILSEDREVPLRTVAARTR